MQRLVVGRGETPGLGISRSVKGERSLEALTGEGGNRERKSRGDRRPQPRIQNQVQIEQITGNTR